jgi:hypothetical protein
MPEWKPGRLWRVLYWNGEKYVTWCVSSDEQEVRDSMKDCPSHAFLQREWLAIETWWKAVK